MTSLPWPARSPAARGSETVLLAEDEAPVRAVARQVLERHGYTVLEAPTAEAALDIAARSTNASSRLTGSTSGESSRSVRITTVLTA